MDDTEVWHVRDGELVGDRPDSWVYVWRLPDSPDPRANILYVGTTGMTPALRSWLHLHSKDKEVGRVRKRFPKIDTEAADIYAFPVPAGMSRPQVKHALVHALADAGLLAPEYVGPPLEGTSHASDAVASYVAEVVAQLT
ncbi:hypothetical protein GCM10011492_12660 [Flexivirga endophytica]|uniref:Uncharacterized protein n=1 Tax=Flexivirga endophytica TaxID=1849103 RepID=A0A916SYW1_9MICO|nr:hypothetical protein [Flexivirga endophytica]GGB24194.1 hypothetical protein GCM10011492_12660 [Flexivirga endophytica]GHB62861.1 hypothetical protein GCM10008112_34770 [Flexivirga endophytica]